MATIWFLSLLFLSCILLAALKHKKRRQHQRKPPSPSGFPIIGNLHQLGGLPHQSLWRLSKKYGPVMLLKFGSIPTVIVSSSETARQVLRVHDLHCCSRPILAGPRALSYNYVDIAFSPFDDYWKELRKMCVQELFSVKRVHSFQPIKEDEVKKLIDSVSESASQGTPVNLSEKFTALTVRVICKAAFGVNFQGTVLNSDRFEKLIQDTFLFLGSFSASDYFPNGGWIIDWLSGLQRQRERSVRDLDAFYEQMFDLHRQGNKEGVEDFVDLLLRLEKEETVIGYGKLTRNHIKAILMNVLIGGIGTSAITMTWAMTELMRNPRVMKKVQSEIRNQVGNKSVITLDDIDQLHYMKMVINETWRLHPPAPLLVPREVMSEFEINGYTIPVKTRLYVNVWAIGRDPDIWKDPEEFLPERFINSSVDAKGQNFELLTFGSGRRMCPAMYMGTSMVEFGLANMLYQFDWQLPEGMVVEDIDMAESPGLAVAIKSEKANMWLLSLVFLICILLAVVLNHKKPRKYRQLPSPPRFPIIGNLHQIGELPHQSLWKLSKKYGPVMHLKLGRVPTVVVSSSETARQVLKVHDLHCCTRPRMIGPKELSYNYLNIAFSPFDDYWKEVRKLAVQELFSTKQVNSIQPIKDEEVKKLIDSITESASQNTPVNLNKKCLALTVSVVCRTAFGVSFEGTVLNSDRFNKIVREALEMLGSFSASDFIPYVGWIMDWLTGLQGRRERSKRDLNAFYEQIFDLHREEKKQGSEDFVDLLLRLEKEEAVLGNDKLTRNHIKAILLDVLLAGIDTSAISMTWAMAELAKNPRVMKKVQSEIRSQIKNKERISFDDTDKLEYLKMVIKETWRLHPTTPLLLPREAMSEFEINGYTIPVKTRLHVNVWAIGRDPDTWKDPEVFLPERFMDNNIDAKGQHFELLTFGSGRRICPAIYMGTTMVEFGLANLLYHFDWKLPAGMVVEDIDMDEAPGVTVNKKHELLLVPEKYCDN